MKDDTSYLLYNFSATQFPTVLVISHIFPRFERAIYWEKKGALMQSAAVKNEVERETVTNRLVNRIDMVLWG